MFKGLQFVIAHVPDVVADKRFYTEKLGFEVENELPGFVQFKQPGGATFAVGSIETANNGTEPELWWFVDNADATYKELVSRGVEIAMPPKDEPFGRAFAIKDQAGQLRYMLQLPASRS